ncbi:unnamed protein product [Rotaria magnacalcarata]|uniref:Uncharacterized protein n=1 Tax=Rotaria magnacalcarata TaxID=392030 RepID=A0A815EE45_9BILA|nr:unnamed protein product [Rotaria magnacalcarata]CAF4090183.1 unnamed protein product [Rotaria magnacalcarata]
MHKLFIVIAFICFSLATTEPHHGGHRQQGDGNHVRSRRSDQLPPTGVNHFPHGHGNHSGSAGEHRFRHGHANHSGLAGEYRFRHGRGNHSGLAGEHKHH